MNYDEMLEKTNAQLVTYHNELATQCEATELNSWKQAKTRLIERIEVLQVLIEDAAIDAEDDELTSLTVDSETFEQLDEPIEEPTGEIIPDEIDAASDLAEQQMAAQTAEATGLTVEEVLESQSEDEPKRTIKSVAVDLLCATAYYENRDEKSGLENTVAEDHPKARSVGYAYDVIIQRIKDEFDGCNTSVACLRWYSVKIRVEEHGYEGLVLPQRRPRAKPRTAG